MNRIVLTLAALLLLTNSLAAEKTAVKTFSPDKRIEMTLRSGKEGLNYSVKYKGRTIVPFSRISVEFPEWVLGDEIKFGKIVKTSGIEDYDLPVGKVSHVRSSFNLSVIPLIPSKGDGIEAALEVKAFDDAVAYRYKLYSTSGKGIRIKNERLDINTVPGTIATVMYFSDFQSSHEGLYNTVGMEYVQRGQLIDMPVLFQTGDAYFAVTEANLVNYAGMYLTMKDSVMTSRLSPRLDNKELSVIAGDSLATPWRVFIISDRLGALIESTALTSLADPCRIDDTSWLKPGKTTFPWWNDTEVPDTTFQPGNNFLTNKYYVDFAADNSLEYHSVYGYADMPWYTDDGPGFYQAGPHADLTKPVPLLDFKGVCDYAESRGVGIHVWLNWAALYKDIDNVFDKFNEWGVKGMMVDFMNRDDQQMIQIQEEILRKAAEHRLFIQFHGASKPSGLSRTWPNEFTREGTYNYEVYKWDSGRLMGADHDIDIPFTRMLAGPTDYHLGGFRSVPYDQYKPHFSHPNVTSTRCHMLGMYVVLESYLSMVCDYPEAYKGQKGFDFIKEVPTTWDETFVPACKLGEYVVIARRKGNKWYLGAINNSKEKEISVPFGFLDDGEYEVKLYCDSEDTDVYPNNLEIKQLTVKKGDTVKVRLSKSGGFAMIVSKP